MYTLIYISVFIMKKLVELDI